MSALETPNRIHAAAVATITFDGPGPGTFTPGFLTNIGFSKIELPDPATNTVVRFGLVNEVGPEEAAPFVQGTPLSAAQAPTIRMGPPDNPTVNPLIDDTPANELVAEVLPPAQYVPAVAGDFYRFFVFLFQLPVTGE